MKIDTGLSDAVWEKIGQIFARYENLDEVVLYGSRAKGNFRSGSDIDLALKGSELTLKILNRISNDLDDLLLPYTFDLAIYNQIENKDLLEHIRRVGVVVFRSDSG